MRRPSRRIVAGGRAVDAGDDVERGRLAGAVGADQADELAVVEREVEVAQRAAGRRTGRSSRSSADVAVPPAWSFGLFRVTSIASDTHAPAVARGALTGAMPRRESAAPDLARAQQALRAQRASCAISSSE